MGKTPGGSTSVRRLIKLFFWVLLVGLPIFAIINLESITDKIKLRGYNPPPAIAQLAASDTMTDKGRHLFYVNRPKLVADKTELRSFCSQNEATVVLGCYKTGDRGIAIIDASDARLSGVEEVTAAHEMLHAAYARLSTKEKNSVNTMLNEYYQNGLTDQRIKDIINVYKERSPDDLENEMHSIFGTEIYTLPTSLESHYAKYMSRRSAVVEFAVAYTSEFLVRQNQISDFDSKLKQQRSEIESEDAQLSALRDQLNADGERLNSLRSAGRAEEFNSGVISYNQRVESYNFSVNRLKDLIANYNQDIVARNEVARDLASLSGELDTRLQTVTPQ